MLRNCSNTLDLTGTHWVEIKKLTILIFFKKGKKKPKINVKKIGYVPKISIKKSKKREYQPRNSSTNSETFPWFKKWNNARIQKVTPPILLINGNFKNKKCPTINREIEFIERRHFIGNYGLRWDLFSW